MTDQRCSILVPEELRDRLKRIADANNSSIYAIIERLLDVYDWKNSDDMA